MEVENLQSISKNEEVALSRASLNLGLSDLYSMWYAKERSILRGCRSGVGQFIFTKGNTA